MAGLLSSVKKRLNLSPGASSGAGDPVVDELRAALAADRVRYDGAERSLLGHDASIYDNRDIAQMFLEGMKWALRLTDGDAAPRPAKAGP